MPGPSIPDRGTLSRGTDYRLSSPAESVLLAHPLWDAVGDEAIPDALADGIQAQRRFDEALTRGDMELARTLATRLIADWNFLGRAQDRSARAADGALLVTGTVRARLTGGQLSVWAPAALPSDMAATYPKRPRDVSEIPPFYPLNVRQWSDALDGNGPRLSPVQDKPPKRLPDAKLLRGALERAGEILTTKLAHLGATSPAGAHAPSIASARASLSALTLRDISAQVHTPLRDAGGPLIDQTEIILFHGAAFSVVLDRFGEPTTLRGTLRYPIVVGEPGHAVHRNVPSPGTYISVQKFGFATFKINGTSVSKVLFGGVGGFDESFGGGVVDRHDIHKRIQGYLDAYGRYAYVACISLRSAADPGDITVAGITDKLPDIAVRTIHYAVAEIGRMLKRQGIARTLASLTDEMIEQIILEVARDRIKWFIIKQLGEKITPFVNAAFAVFDVITGEDERRRVLNGIAALLIALRGRTSDEDTVAAKVLGLIAAEEIQQKVIQALVRAAMKPAVRGGPASREDAAGTTPETPVSEPGTPAPVSAPPESSRPLPISEPAHPQQKINPPTPRFPLQFPAQPGLPGGITAGGTQPARPARLEPATPRQDDATTQRGTGNPATPGEPADVPVTKAPPGREPERQPAPRPDEAANVRGTDDRGTQAAGTDDKTTSDGAIMRIGVDPIGEHTRDPAALTSRRGLIQATPETGTQLGFQTHIGKEIVTAIGPPGHEVPVTSRDPDVLIGANTGRFRDDALAIIANNPDHPMRPVYDENTKAFVRPPYKDGNMQQWELHPYDWQAGHARSDVAGDAEVIIFQTRFRNQEQSARLERHGSVTKDEVVNVGGIAVEKLSAWDLYRSGHLKLPEGKTPDSLPTMKL